MWYLMVSVGRLGFAGAMVCWVVVSGGFGVVKKRADDNAGQKEEVSFS